MAEFIPWIPVAMSVGSMIFGSKGASNTGAAARLNAQRQQQADEFEAQQLEIQAGQVVAAGQRGALEEERQARLVQSRAIAVAAASGGSVADPTVINILARSAGEGTYRAGVALYQGEERAREMRMQAVGKRFEGQIAIEGGQARAQAARTQGITSLLSTGASLFTKYGGGGDAALIQEYVPGQFSLTNPAYG